jgi:hypothetical protein
VNKLVRALMPILFLAAASEAAVAQTDNLVQSPNADPGSQVWRAEGRAAVEDCGHRPCFVVRDGGYFYEDVMLPEKAEGKYLVLLGSGSSERVNPDGAITGLPCLYGYMMPREGERVLAYMQGQKMLGAADVPETWLSMWGVYRVPAGAGRVRFFLKQALQKGVPHNGSAARFADLGLYLFSSEDEAKSFVHWRR